MIGEKSQNLICGTLGKIIELRSQDELAGFTPTNPPKVASTVSDTASAIFPALADTAIIFADRTNRHLYEMIYDNSEGTITAPDLTVLASHICGTSGIKQLAWQRSPYTMLWAVRNDGKLATLYYDRSYKVAAWTRQITDGKYTSVAVVPTQGGLDRVWTLVNRTIDGNSVYYAEYFGDVNVDPDINDVFYVDSGAVYDGNGTPATTFSIPHLKGKTVAVLADGSYYGTTTVSAGGTVTLTDSYNQVVIGLPYTTTLTPIDLDITSNQQSLLPFMKKETGLYLNVYKTQGGKYGPSTTILKDIQWPRSSTPPLVAAPLELYTGSKTVPVFSGARTDAGYSIIQTDPLPFILRAMVTMYEATP